MQKFNFEKSYLSDLDPSNYLVLIVFAGSWDKIQIRFWDPLSSKTTWFTAYLHDFGTKSRFSFGTLILQTTSFTAKFAWFWDKIQIQFLDPDPPNISKPPCLQFICMILGPNLDSLFGSWSSKPVAFTAYLHDLGTKSRFSFRILILQTSCFAAYLHDLGTKSRFSFSDPDPKKGLKQMYTNVYKSLSSTM